MTHRFPLRVYYEDTDLGGIVYHANYLRFTERARSEWVEAMGIDQMRLKDETGTVFAVRRIEADFLAPARLGDRLVVETAVADRAGARIVLDQIVLRDGVALFRARVTLAAMGPSGRPVRLPPALRGPG
ncbi:MAG: tol-pal system-associated acyl-CoA thioesterase [Tranquillimonas sp.]|jgi:acyl-CoA thioester hydrolase